MIKKFFHIISILCQPIQIKIKSTWDQKSCCVLSVCGLHLATCSVLFMLQMLLCVTSLGYIVCYIYRFVLVSEIVEFLRSTFYKQFISLAFLTAWDEVRNWSLCLCIDWSHHRVWLTVLHFHFFGCLTHLSGCLSQSCHRLSVPLPCMSCYIFHTCVCVAVYPRSLIKLTVLLSCCGHWWGCWCFWWWWPKACDLCATVLTWPSLLPSIGEIAVKLCSWLWVLRLLAFV